MADGFYDILQRNLNELRYAISMRNCLNELSKIAPETNWTFFTYCYLALFNDTFSHEIKVLDRHKDAASFWYIRNCEPDIISELLKKYDLEIGELEELSGKLKLIRDKTHFHIDKKGVLDSRQIWIDANINGDYINGVIDKLWNILNELHIVKFGGPFGQPIHNGEDVADILTVCKFAGIKI